MEAHAPQEWAESSKDGTQVNGDWCDLKKMKKERLSCFAFANPTNPENLHPIKKLNLKT
jgi:hypothetical protein